MGNMWQIIIKVRVRLTHPSNRLYTLLAQTQKNSQIYLEEADSNLFLGNFYKSIRIYIKGNLQYVGLGNLTIYNELE